MPTTEKPYTFLMCPPDYFGVDYVINPWMDGNIDQVNKMEMQRQFAALHALVSLHANVKLINPVNGLPDLVFTANAGLPLLGSNICYISTFATKERAPESEVFKQWFEKEGWECKDVPFSFEGAGDALYDYDMNQYVIGHSQRTKRGAYIHLAAQKKFKVMEAQLLTPEFYHLDTCFCPLSGGEVIYYPEALDPTFVKLLNIFHSEDTLIEVNREDALAFACNAVEVAPKVIVMPMCSDRLQYKLMTKGYTVYVRNMSEFLKAGGACKCLTLRIK